MLQFRVIFLIAGGNLWSIDRYADATGAGKDVYEFVSLLDFMNICSCSDSELSVKRTWTEARF